MSDAHGATPEVRTLSPLTNASRRRFLTGAVFTTLIGVDLGLTRRAWATPPPSVTCMPATNNVGIVLASGLAAGGNVVVSDAAGHPLASAPVTAGSAVVHVPVAHQSIQRVRVQARGFTRDVTLATTTSALKTSSWLLVDKRLSLPRTFSPSPLTSVGGGQLRSDVARAYVTMKAAAAKEHIGMGITSAYRSYATQIATYDHWVRVLGKAAADRVSARPGFSEHQTGMAIDIVRPDGRCTLETCFGSTSLGKWLRANCHNFGFVVRYENGYEATTGYSWEPWHLRFLGVPMATAYLQHGAHTIEQMFGFPAAPNY